MGAASGRYGRMTALLAACLSLSGVGASCSGSPASADLSTTARRYAEALLVGTADDVRRARGPACTERLGDAELAQLRGAVAALASAPATAVHVTTVRTRNVTGTAGEAVTVLDATAAAQGNDNWLAYRKVGGHWQLATCDRLPFGGRSTS